jgi:Methylamine utilisation protein MauE
MLLVDIGTAFAGFLAVITGISGWRKLQHREHYAGVIAAYSVVPYRIGVRLPLLIGTLECAAAVALLFPATRLHGAIVAAALLAIYAGAMVIALVRGHAGMDCGCGPPWSRQPLAVGHVVRTVALIVCALPVYLAGAGVPVDIGGWARALLIATCLLVLYRVVDFLLTRDALLSDD